MNIFTNPNEVKKKSIWSDPFAAKKNLFVPFEEVKPLTEDEQIKKSANLSVSARFAGEIVPQALKTIGSMGQEVMRSGARIGATIEKGLGLKGSKLPIPLDEQGEFQPKGKLQQTVFGKEPVGSFEKLGEDVTGGYVRGRLAAGIGIGLTALDVAPGGAFEKKGISTAFKGFSKLFRAGAIEDIRGTGIFLSKYSKIASQYGKDVKQYFIPDNLKIKKTTTRSSLLKELDPSWDKEKVYDRLIKEGNYSGTIDGLTAEQRLQTLIEKKIKQKLSKEGFDGVEYSGNKFSDQAGEVQIFNPKMLKETAGETSAFKGFDDLTTKTVEMLKGKVATSKQFISDLTNNPGMTEAERDLIRGVLDRFPDGKTVNATEFANEVKTELLPLKVLDSKDIAWMENKWENIVLPPKLRGNIASYSEHVYESPIKNSAGDVHYPGISSGYFAHSRIENMARGGDDILMESFSKGEIGGKQLAELEESAGDTRRVIEVQSDLFQKRRLESEIRNAKAYDDLLERGVVQKKLDQESRAQIDKLKSYKNTWFKRPVQEEIKQASIDGKTKLQFPTGETAMKIEGLGEHYHEWEIIPKGRTHIARGDYEMNQLSKSNMKVGQEISQENFIPQTDRWIVTEVLGDGKFKAVPERQYNLALHPETTLGSQLRAEGYETLGDLPQKQKEEFIQKQIEGFTEQFDISGKVDTSNQIYKFYENDIQKYLKKIAPDMKLITDDKGVNWFEVPITPEMADQPISAFGDNGLKTAFKGFDDLTTRAIANANINKDARLNDNVKKLFPNIKSKAAEIRAEDNVAKMMKKDIPIASESNIINNSPTLYRSASPFTRSGARLNYGLYATSNSKYAQTYNSAKNPLIEFTIDPNSKVINSVNFETLYANVFGKGIRKPDSFFGVEALTKGSLEWIPLLRRAESELSKKIRALGYDVIKYDEPTSAFIDTSLKKIVNKDEWVILNEKAAPGVYKKRKLGELGSTPLKTLLGVSVGTAGAKALFTPSKTEYKKSKEEKPDTALTAGQFGDEITEFQIKDRPVKIQVAEMDELGGVLFGEANNSIEEMRTIANVVINRANASNKTILQELTKKTSGGGFEFNAYAGKQYNKYRSNDFDFISEQKANKVRQILDEIQNGTLVDNTDGAIYFSHNSKGEIGAFKDLYENIKHVNN